MQAPTGWPLTSRHRPITVHANWTVVLRVPKMPRLYWHPEISDGLVIEDASGALWIVARPLTSDSLRPFQGDRAQLEPIAALGQEVPGQLGPDLVGITE